MNTSPASTYTRALALGIVSGMRSMMAPALAARKAADDPGGMPDLLTRPQTRAALGVMAAGELVVDNSPSPPAARCCRACSSARSPARLSARPSRRRGAEVRRQGLWRRVGCGRRDLWRIPRPSARGQKTEGGGPAGRPGGRRAGSRASDAGAGGRVKGRSVSSLQQQ